MLCCQLKCSICQTKYHERNGLFQSSYWHTLCIVCKLNFPQVLLNVHTHITFVHNNPMQKLMLKGRLQGFYFICFEKFYISIFRIFLSPLWSTNLWYLKGSNMFPLNISVWSYSESVNLRSNLLRMQIPFSKSKLRFNYWNGVVKRKYFVIHGKLRFMGNTQAIFRS